MDRRFLFADDGDSRGYLYSKQFLVGHGASINEANPDEIVGKDAYSLMAAADYQTKDRAFDQDVHWEFTDFVIKTALFHREIDQSTRIGNKLMLVETAVKGLNVDTELTAIANAFKSTLPTIPPGVIAKGGDKRALARAGMPAAQAATDALSNKIINVAKITDPAMTITHACIAAKIPVKMNSLILEIAQDLIADYISATPSATPEADFVKNFSTKVLNEGYEAAQAGVEECFQTKHISMSNAHAKALYDNIFSKWNDLDTDTINFYNTFCGLQKVDQLGHWMDATADLGKPITNLASYRVNLKKKENGAEETLFGERLPKYSKLFPKVWYTSTSGSHNSIIPTDAFFFRKLYNDIYNKKPSTPSDIPQTYEEASKLSPGPWFNVNVDDIVRKALFRISKAKIATPADSNDVGQDYFDMINSNVWKRDADGSFYLLNPNTGAKVKYGAEDPETIRMLKSSHKCYSSLLNASGADCNTYIMQCLLDDDASKLEAYLKTVKQNPDIFNVAKKEINSMHPIIALRTLQKFGFRKYRTFDTFAGAEIYKVESVDHWTKNYLEKQFKDTDVQKMFSGNSTLLMYLDLISQYVNSNPAMLNKGFSGCTEEGSGTFKMSEYASKLPGMMARKQPLGGDMGRYEINMFRSYAKSRSPVNPFFVASSGKVYTPFGVELNPGVPVVIPAMRGQIGGGPVDSATSWLLRRFNNDAGCEPVFGSSLIRNVMQDVYSTLNAKGKKLSEDEQKRIEHRINKLAELEQELIRTIYFIDEFNRLCDSFTGYKCETLTEANIAQFVKRYEKITSKAGCESDSLVDILAKLQQVVAGDDGSAYSRTRTWIMSGNTSEIGDIGESPGKSSLFFLTVFFWTLESDCPARRFRNWQSDISFVSSGALSTIRENPMA